MIHLVTCANRAAYAPEVQALHRARKQVFVDELGWQLKVENGLEYDEYDDDRALCVIGFGADRDVAMSVRLRPADDRSMLADHFSHVLPKQMRAIDDGLTWEVSRGFCREMGRKRHNLLRKAACMLSPLEVALAAGMNRLVGFSDVRMYSFFVNIGWRLSVLGSAVPYGEGDGFAYEVEVSPEAVATMRARWGLPDPAHIYLDSAQLAGRSIWQAEAKIGAANPALGMLLPVALPVPLPTLAPDYFGASVGTFERRVSRRVAERVINQRTTG